MDELLNDRTGQLFLVKDFDKQRDVLIENWFDTNGMRQETIKMFGKEYLQPRLIRFEGDESISYTYSRKKLKAQPWSKVTLELRSHLKQLFNMEFNSVLINCYRDGSDSMGLHADNEPELGSNPVIASVSYGAEREIIFKENNGKRTMKIILPHGSLLIMKGALQHDWKHEIRKTAKSLNSRLNFTFRTII